MSKLIIITGSQGSGKTRKAIELCFGKDFTEKIVKTGELISVENELDIYVTQKSSLVDLLKELQRRDFLIIDMDYDNRQI